MLELRCTECHSSMLISQYVGFPLSIIFFVCDPYEFIFFNVLILHLHAYFSQHGVHEGCKKLKLNLNQSQ